jgi:hypothetical protein
MTTTHPFGQEHVRIHRESDGREGYFWREGTEILPLTTRGRFAVRPRVAEGAERERLWAAMNEVWPHYAEYQERTDREIPVVVLERA